MDDAGDAGDVAQMLRMQNNGPGGNPTPQRVYATVSRTALRKMHGNE